MNNGDSATNKARQLFGLPPIYRCLPILVFIIVSCGVFVIRFEILPVSVRFTLPLPVPYLPISTTEHLTTSSFDRHVNKTSIR